MIKIMATKIDTKGKSKMTEADKKYDKFKLRKKAEARAHIVGKQEQNQVDRYGSRAASMLDQNLSRSMKKDKTSEDKMIMERNKAGARREIEAQVKGTIGEGMTRVRDRLRKDRDIAKRQLKAFEDKLEASKKKGK